MKKNSNRVFKLIDDPPGDSIWSWSLISSHGNRPTQFYAKIDKQNKKITLKDKDTQLELIFQFEFYSMPFPSHP